MGVPQKFEENVSHTGSRDALAGDGITFSKGGPRRKVWIMFVILFLLVLAALIAVSVLLGRELNKEDKDVCTTASCVSAVHGVLSKMDESVDPCEDFYEFSCGKWLRERVIPEDKSKLSMFGELNDMVNIKLKDLLERPITNSDKEYIQKAKTFYASCNDYAQINKLGPMPLMDKIVSDYGGWPLTNSSWNPNAADITSIMAALRVNGALAIVSFGPSSDLKDTSKRVLVIDQPGFGMPSRDNYLVANNDTILQAYKELIYQIGKVYGFADPNTARDEVDEIVDFETKLANISVPKEERRDSNKLYNPTTLGEVSRNYSHVIDWTRMLKSLFSLPEVKLAAPTEQEIIINHSPKYFEALNELFTQTDKRIIVNYLVWMQIRYMAYSQGDQIRNHFLPYSKALRGTNTRPPRFQTCVGDTNDELPFAVGKLFVKDNFDSESKTKALTMIGHLKESLNEIFDEVEWLDAETRQKAKEKNQFIVEKIGYPELLNNETAMIERFKEFTFSADQYMNNIFNLNIEGFKTGLAKLRQPIDKTKADYGPAVVNAYYDPSQNQILFPAGILQPPFFSKDFPDSLNYGGIGVAIGHELTHGFDDQGRQHDKVGNLVQWWNDDVIQKFKIQAQCIIDQYGNFSVEGTGMNLNGINTLGENIADNGGLKESFKAYRKLIAKRGKEEQPLPGIKYSHDQLFFINFGQIWCQKVRQKAKIIGIRTDPHSLGRFRTIGTVQNSKDFSRVFGCSAKAKMNPKKKCSVW